MRVIYWMIGCAIWWTLVALGLVGDIVGVQRVMLFIVNLAFVGTVLSWMMPSAPRKPGARPWRWLRILDDVLRVGAFVWFGWWWSAIAYTIACITFEAQE